jgi:predicted nucleic acid-binding protein
LILFSDTSALIKLYIDEPDSQVMADAASEATTIVVCRIAWVEMMSAFARRVREQPSVSDAVSQARRHFVEDWSQLLVTDVTQQIVELAGDYAEAFALRAYDGVQLASIQSLHLQLPGEVKFACYDSRLVKAARVLGIESS